MSLALVAAVVASFLYGLGSVLQAVGARRGGGGVGMRGLAGIVGQAPYVAGLACDLVGWVLAMYAVDHLPLFAVHTTLAGSVAVTALLAWRVLHTPLGRLDAVAIAAVLAGLVLVGAAAGPVPDDRGGTATHALLVGLVPVAVAVGVAAVRGRHPVLAGAAAGLLFSLGATCVRTVTLGPTLAHVLGQPTAWAVPAYFGAALVVHARALEHGSVGPVTAALWSAEIVVAATGGYVLFGDRVRSGGLAWALLGMALALSATVALALGPARAAAAASSAASASSSPSAS